uniref:Uncharacterized protein n=1 Tax=Lepeophtheirus salmonis TaxID=72036 RepID=A0A0K2TMF6_LEPSM
MDDQIRSIFLRFIWLWSNPLENISEKCPYFFLIKNTGPDFRICKLSCIWNYE